MYKIYNIFKLTTSMHEINKPINRIVERGKHFSIVMITFNAMYQGHP